MTVTAPISATQHPATNANIGRGATVTSDFQTFLKMLTTQMQNQDPLNPMDSSDFAVQLATFSGVEQQVQTNQMLRTLSAQLGTMTMSQLSGWIGMEARVATVFQHDGAPVTVMPRPDAVADKAVLVVEDASGREVARIGIPARAEPLVWDGRDGWGADVPAGRYRLEVESYAQDQLIGRTPAEVYLPVHEARSGADGAVMLVFGGNVEVPATAATALRRPD